MYRIKFLNTLRGQMAVPLGAYIVGESWRSDVVDVCFRHGNNREDVACSGTLIPADAPHSFRDGDGKPNARAIWNAADRTGVSSNKRNKHPTWKKRAQLGMHVIGALPYDTTDAIRREIAERHADEYRQRGAAVTWSIHRPTDAKSRNFHFHMLVSTKRVTKDGFDRQLRNLAASFSRGESHDRATIHKDSPPKRWRAWLENFARENGLEFQIDDPYAVPGVHWNEGPQGILSENKARDAAAFAAAQAMVRDPGGLLDVITARQAVFTAQDLRRVLARHEIPDDEAEAILDRALADSQIRHLRDSAADAEDGLYTTAKVRAQERRIREAALRVHGRPRGPEDALQLRAAVAKLRAEQTLSEEQWNALEHCIGTEGLAIVQGVAGAGKSYTMSMIRRALENAGYRVIGVAPTNAVASDMASDGFTVASTIHQELFRQTSKSGRYIRWDRKTCVLGDEAGMYDAGIYEGLLVTAAETGARVVLVGDDKQLSSIERGGIYADLRKTFGCSFLREVRRQNAGWGKEASLCFAEGRILEGLQAYGRRGYITLHDELADAAGSLIRRRAEDRAKDPTKRRFVIAATRASVQNLNKMCQQSDWKQTPPARIGRFKTADDEVDLGVGDRVQFAANERDLGIVNGLLGTVVALADDEITVQADDGKTITFDPAVFDKWGLGFAGTVFRSQGRTHAQVYCLYDHKGAWGASTSYVAFTRHRESVRCYVPRNLAADIDMLARQMSKNDPRASSLDFVCEEELSDAVEASSVPTPGRPVAPARRDDIVPKSEIVVAQSVSDLTSIASRNQMEVASAINPQIPLPPELIEQSQDHNDRAPADELVGAVIGASTGAGSSAGRRSAVLQAMPYRARLQERVQEWDLGSKVERIDLLKALNHAPMAQVVKVYQDIQRLNPSDAQMRDQLQNLRGLITSQARIRGYWPGLNRVDKNCLEGSRLDPDNIIDVPTLRPERGEVDIRPLVERLYQREPHIRRNLEASIEPLCVEAKRNILDSLLSARQRSAGDEELSLAIVNTAGWFYGVCYRLGEDLRPDLTRLRGQVTTPEEYCHGYLPLWEKAVRAAGDLVNETETDIEAPPRKRRPWRADHGWIRDQTLCRLYRERLTAQIERTVANHVQAKRVKQGRLPTNGEETTAERLVRLRRKLASFENDMHRVTWTAFRESPIDFLPADIGDDELRPVGFQGSEAAGFRAIDQARLRLEALLEVRMFGGEGATATPMALGVPTATVGPLRELD